MTGTYARLGMCADHYHSHMPNANPITDSPLDYGPQISMLRSQQNAGGSKITTPMNQDAFSDTRLEPSLKRLGPKQGNVFPPVSKKALAWWDLGAQTMAS